MPRRRLHGETQKRRKKPQTRLLKRSETPVRTRSTHQAAPFERSDRIDREDLEFLEAMREMDVQRNLRQGESAARRQALERVQFLADDGEGALFQRSMAHLGVTPAASARPTADWTVTATEASPDSPPSAVAIEPRPVKDGSLPEAEPSPIPEQDSVAPQPTPASPHTKFEADGDAQTLMAALLDDDGFQPELKFAGAGAPARRSLPARPPWEHPDAEPDDELDLHGKTQEEAIHMVQNFLLTCQRRRLRHVLIITGRGRNSGAAGPVLKQAVHRWLDLNGKRFARNVAQAPPHLGGEGALWLTLR